MPPKNTPNTANEPAPWAKSVKLKPEHMEHTPFPKVFWLNQLISQKRTRGTHGTRKQYKGQRHAKAKAAGWAAWQRLRLAILQASPLCVNCEAKGRVAAAVVPSPRCPERGKKSLRRARMAWRHGLRHRGGLRGFVSR
jgi:hypothetical protein